VCAASLFSKFEYRSFWVDVFPILIMAVLAVFCAAIFRRKARRQLAVAPADAIRSDGERLLHYLSLLFISLPLIYTFCFEIDLLWTQFGILAAQVAIMMTLKFFKVKFIFRSLFLIPSFLLSIVAGELILIWPHTELSLIETGTHLTLALCGLSFSLGNLLSYISFPAAYRARAW
jgi:hypothetical protein